MLTAGESNRAQPGSKSHRISEKSDEHERKVHSRRTDHCRTILFPPVCQSNPTKDRPNPLGKYPWPPYKSIGRMIALSTIHGITNPFRKRTQNCILCCRVPDQNALHLAKSETSRLTSRRSYDRPPPSDTEPYPNCVSRRSLAFVFWQHPEGRTYGLYNLTCRRLRVI